MRRQVTLNPIWIGKFAGLAAVCLALAGWCIYDGAVAFPDHNAQVQSMRQRHDRLTAEGQLQRWPSVAQTEGWPATDPHQLKLYRPGEIQSQWAFAGVCLAAALAAIGWLIFNRRHRLTVDEQGLITGSGQRVAYPAIEHIDKSQWDSRGIAHLHGRVDGKLQLIRLDDWLQRGAAEALQTIEQHTGLGDGLTDRNTGV